MSHVGAGVELSTAGSFRLAWRDSSHVMTMAASYSFLVAVDERRITVLARIIKLVD